MPALAMRFDASPINSWPPNAIEPRRCPTMPIMARKVVVLPAPLRPSSVTSSPSPTENSIPCRMCDSPYQACRSATRSNALSRTAVSGMSGPHIGLDDFGVFRDLRVGALRQDLSAGKHGDGVRQIGDDGEIVLDHQHRAIRRDGLDQRRNARDVLLAEPGHRLVEQQHLGIERKGGRDLSRTLRCGNTAEIWNERTMPRRAMSAGFSGVMSRPL